VNTGGSILTHGDQSTGLLAQSVGGGGGNGGYSVTVAGAVSNGAAVSMGVGFAGAGGNGGMAQTVNATYGGNVTTEGVNSDAIILQAVGGGGGNGGYNVTGAVAGAGGVAGAVAIGVGAVAAVA